MTQIISLPVALVWTYFKAAVVPLAFLYPYSIGASLGAICLAIGIAWGLRVPGSQLSGLALLILFILVSPFVIWLAGSIGGVVLFWVAIAIGAAIVLGALARTIVGASHSGPAVLIGVFIVTFSINSYFVAVVALTRDMT